MADQKITPVTGDEDEQTQPRLTIDPSVQAPDGSFYVFDGVRGYRQVVEPWASERHIGPSRAAERLGDAESWCAYVRRYAAQAGGVDPLLTWSTAGLKAVLDYHEGMGGTAGRCWWTAEHPFTTTRQWQAWQQLADNRGKSQKALIEALEERRQDIRQPDAATLVGMLRSLRATVNTAAEYALDEHGNSVLKYSREANTPLKLPPSITIGIPVLKGHTAVDSQGVEGPVVYALDVLIRVDILDEGDKSRPSFRLTIPNAEQALEDAVADRVAKARALLPPEFALYRAAS